MPDAQSVQGIQEAYRYKGIISKFWIYPKVLFPSTEDNGICPIVPDKISQLKKSITIFSLRSRSYTKTKFSPHLNA